MLKNGGNACFVDRTEGDSTGNEAEFSDHSLTTDRVLIYHNGRETRLSVLSVMPSYRRNLHLRQIVDAPTHEELDAFERAKWADERGGRKVYFIQAGDRIKIGVTKNVRKRIAVMQTGSSVPLVLLATRKGDTGLEREYHARFAHLRLHGEWFEANPAIMSEVDCILSGAL